LEIHDMNLFEGVPQIGDQNLDQIVGERPDGSDPLLLEHDRRGLRLPYPDGQIPLTTGLPQQQDGLILWLLDPDADHAHFAHRTASHTPRPPALADAGLAVPRV